MDKDAKEARNRRIFELWLACWTQQEIAEELGCTQGEIAKSIPNGNIAERNKTDQAAAEHATDFTPPIYNIWKQQEVFLDRYAFISVQSRQRFRFALAARNPDRTMARRPGSDFAVPLTDKQLATLRAAREAQGLGQGDLAERLGVGNQHVSDVERGHRVPSRDLLERWCSALGFEVEIVPASAKLRRVSK